MPIAKLRKLHRSPYLSRCICSTGAEEAALAEAALGELGVNTAGMTAAEMTAGGVGASSAAAEAAAALSTLGITPGSVALQAGGAILKGAAARDAAARKKRLVDAMAAYQTGNATKSMDTTAKFLEGSTPEARAAALAGAEDANRAGYEKTVGAAQAFEQPGGVAGKLSEGYTRAAADSADAVARRSKMLIENLSRMRAPGVAGATESRRYARAAGDVDALNAANASVGRGYMTDIGNVQASPWAKLGGDALSGIGAGLQIRDALKKARATSTTLGLPTKALDSDDLAV